MAIDIVTFGCRLNTYESEVMRREAETAGLGELEQGAVIFNTCAVTAEAVQTAAVNSEVYRIGEGAAATSG